MAPIVYTTTRPPLVPARRVVAFAVAATRARVRSGNRRPGDRQLCERQMEDTWNTVGAEGGEGGVWNAIGTKKGVWNTIGAKGREGRERGCAQGAKGWIEGSQGSDLPPNKWIPR
jgi:hypothetical protein